MRLRHRLVTLRTRPVRIPVVLVGLGAIGLEVGRLVVGRPDLFRLIGAADRAPDLAGRSLVQLLGPGAPKRRVVATIQELPPGGEVAFHTTASQLALVSDTLRDLLQHGLHVVSSSEELAYPWLRATPRARKLDRLARQENRVVVGAGINPGFAMDVWPLTLSSNMQEITRADVVRVVDASQRRESLQRKVGSGLTTRAFEQLARQGRIGHVGLLESAVHLGAELGWKLDQAHETLEPCVARRRIGTRFLDVPKGRVSGIHHRVLAFENNKLRVTLDLRMELGARSPRDVVELHGVPSLTCTVPGGFHGDRATAAQLVAAARRVGEIGPGLHLASDLPVPRTAAQRVRLRLG